MTKKNPQSRTTSSKPAENAQKSFLDTSVTIKLRAGHSEHRAHLSRAIPQPHYVNGYVRMEFYRAVLLHWIHLYFESEHGFHRTFSDALTFCSDSFGRGPKAYLSAIAAVIQNAGFAIDSPSEKEVCRRKLEDIIFSMARAFESAYRDIGDPTQCARVRSPLRVSSVDPRSKTLIEFATTFADVKESRSRCSIEKFFERGKYSPQMRTVEQGLRNGSASDLLERMDGVLRKGNDDPASVTCSMCEKVGDAIIAITVPLGWKLHSLDTAHELICKALEKPAQIHPSAARLKAINPNLNQPGVDTDVGP